jgi:hypothetical protein
LVWRDIKNFIKNDGSPLPPVSSDMLEGEGGGPAVVEVKTEKKLMKELNKTLIESWIEL